MSIGRDHTIFANEPGFVQFYFDPFHPKRRLVGIALRKDIRLPLPHWEPRVRRFGHVLLADPVESKREMDHMSRKEYLATPIIKQAEEKRAADREVRKNKWAEIVPKIIDLQGEELNVAINRLISVRAFLSGGRSIKESRDLTTFNFTYDLTLATQRGEIAKEVAEKQKSEYLQVAEKVDATTTFDSRFRLYKSIPSDQKRQKVTKILAKIDELYKQPTFSTSETRAQIAALIHSGLIDMPLRVKLIRKYLKRSPSLERDDEITPSSKQKEVTIKSWNYEKKKLEIIKRPSGVFPPASK